jgi:SNF2 family DNA or RNA helicase
MLDVLEDYLNNQEVNFERIDGSITGNKQQQAIDRFQVPTLKKPLLCSCLHRAGGVGIN